MAKIINSKILLYQVWIQSDQNYDLQRGLQYFLQRKVLPFYIGFTQLIFELNLFLYKIYICIKFDDHRIEIIRPLSCIRVFSLQESIATSICATQLIFTQNLYLKSWLTIDSKLRPQNCFKAFSFLEGKSYPFCWCHIVQFLIKSFF